MVIKLELTQEQAALQEARYDAAARKLGEDLAQNGLLATERVVSRLMGIIELHNMLKAAAQAKSEPAPPEPPPNGAVKNAAA